MFILLKTRSGLNKNHSNYNRLVFQASLFIIDLVDQGTNILYLNANVRVMFENNLWVFDDSIPAGVPVIMIVPASRVVPWEKYAINGGTVKIISLV